MPRRANTATARLRHRARPVGPFPPLEQLVRKAVLPRGPVALTLAERRWAKGEVSRAQREPVQLLCPTCSMVVEVHDGGECPPREVQAAAVLLRELGPPAPDEDGAVARARAGAYAVLERWGASA